MKILHIIAGGERGGAETFCLDAIKSLHESGIEQEVICRAYPNFTKALSDRNIPYRTLTFSRYLKVLEQRIVMKSIKQSNVDVVHSWMGRASSFLPKRVDTPVLGWFGSCLNFKNFHNCDYFMGVTGKIVEHIQSHITHKDRAFLVHTFGTLEQDTPLTKADFNINEDTKTILMLARMHWQKGVDLLLNAATQIPDVHLLLAGDGPELEQYQALAKDLGIADRTHFLGWREDRAALLGVADICALPSREDAFGTVIAESWYAGVPLVAARADGPKQYIVHEGNGLLSDIDDVDTLAKNIQTILNDENMRQNIMNGGRDTYERLFSKEIVTKSLIDTYENISKRGKPTS